MANREIVPAQGFGVMIAVAAVVCLADQNLDLERSGLLRSLQAAGLGAFLGAVTGTVLAVLLAITQRSGRIAGFLLWLATTESIAWWLLRRLGAIEKLSGPHRDLARLSVVGAIAAGIFLAATAVLLRRRRRGLALALAAAAIAVAYLERVLFRGTYPKTHDMARGFSAVCAAFAFLAATPGRRWPIKASLLAALSAALVMAVPFATITPENDDAVSDLLGRPFPGLALRAARRLFDVDSDGSATVLGERDCPPFNPDVGPNAREIPGNGVDDNCRGGDAPLPDPRVGEADVPLPESAAPMSVVLVTLDTVRADHLGLYGYSRSTSPRLDAWALAGTVYERAFTSGGITSLAISSLMRGLYPRRFLWTTFGVTDRFSLLSHPERNPPPGSENIVFRYILPASDPAVPLARWLERRGMITLAVTGFGNEMAIFARDLGGRGFNSWQDVVALPPSRRSDAGTTDLALAALRGAPRGVPFFLWVHYYGPHSPDEAHPELPVFGTGPVDRYDHELAFVDQELGRFLEGLAQLRAANEVAIIVTSDHGEQFRSDGSRLHGADLMQASIHVPLIIRAPGFPAKRVTVPVSLVDLAPTILALTQTPAPRDLDGVDLGRPVPPRHILVDSWWLRPGGIIGLDLTAVIGPSNKLIFDHLNQVSSFDDPDSSTRKRYEDTLHRYLDETGGTPRFEE